MMPNPSALKFRMKVTRFSTALPRAEMAALGAASMAVKAAILARSPRRLSGVGTKGARIGVGYKLLPATEKFGAKAIVSARGPFHLIERDTKGHEIRPKRKRAMTVGDGVRAGTVRHPGTKGQHPFERGVDQTRPVVVAIFRRAFNTSMRSTFGL